MSDYAEQMERHEALQDELRESNENRGELLAEYERKIERLRAALDKHHQDGVGTGQHSCPVCSGGR